MKDALSIFRFLLEAVSRGEGAVLVTLTEVTGSSSRAIGTHMAVSASGAYAGSLSGGCVEAAVVAEALDVLRRGAAELVRFGAGSRYLDIRLPCGGGIDLLFTPDPPPQIVIKSIAQLESRCAISLSLGLDGSFELDGDAPEGWSDGCFTVSHEPDLRLVIVGHGAETISLARMAQAYGADLHLLSPDAFTLTAARSIGVNTTHLLTPASTAALSADVRTAITFLFHDHDWEPALMMAALGTPAHFIGAMGSRRTHARRCAILTEHGASSEDLARIKGPIGLIPATRDPDTLALSILAQIAQASLNVRTHDYVRPYTAPVMNAQHEGMLT